MLQKGVAVYFFGLDFFIILAILSIFLLGIPIIVRNLLGADKKKWFSNNHMNEFHKKVDSRFRAIFVILIFASLPWSINEPLVISGMLALFTIVLLGLQTFAEWKFSSNRQNFKVSLIEIALFLIAFLGVVFWFS
ncbi:DUF4181 domain-containing protein [Halobacillus halophilus]|uniref:DUF4181 domain-containing protein n=1 Tax=Halobacillus halophilus TaxID=1570 RepID=UPI001CD49952|nr:DUF4181 domain-containing protein [Halobacillus halophilus]